MSILSSNAIRIFRSPLTSGLAALIITVAVHRPLRAEPLRGPSEEYGLIGVLNRPGAAPKDVSQNRTPSHQVQYAHKSNQTQAFDLVLTVEKTLVMGEKRPLSTKDTAKARLNIKSRNVLSNGNATFWYSIARSKTSDHIANGPSATQLQRSPLVDGEFELTKFGQSVRHTMNETPDLSGESKTIIRLAHDCLSDLWPHFSSRSVAQGAEWWIVTPIFASSIRGTENKTYSLADFNDTHATVRYNTTTVYPDESLQTLSPDLHVDSIHHIGTGTIDVDLSSLARKVEMSHTMTVRGSRERNGKRDSFVKTTKTSITAIPVGETSDVGVSFK
jgi:hypothetical protein